MPEGRQLRFGTVALGALTVLLVLAALGNLAQRIEVVRPDDGVVWVDEGAGVAAARVEPGGAGARMGLRVGDRIDFTFYRPDSDTWSNRNYSIAVV